MNENCNDIDINLKDSIDDFIVQDCISYIPLGYTERPVKVYFEGDSIKCRDVTDEEFKEMLNDFADEVYNQAKKIKIEDYKTCIINDKIGVYYNSEVEKHG